MSFYSYDVLNLVRDFGQPLVLNKVTSEGSYNPATGSVDNSAVTDYPFTGYFYNTEAGIAGNLDEIKRGSRRCVIPALGFSVEPDSDDIISGVGDKVTIVSVVTIYSAGAKVCYLCNVRE